MRNQKLAQIDLGVTFDNPSILDLALTHRSYINENEGREHNERLEFLGDAVLELVITDFLFNKFKKEPEGKLTAYRAALVNTQSLSDTATKLNINKHLKLSKGEAKDTGRARDAILANTVEAIIGAVFLDGGYARAEKFILNNIAVKIDKIVSDRSWQDSKSYFQEMAQKYENDTPSYEVLSEEGPDHDKVFSMGVYLKDKLVAKGAGKSKQDAEQDAAAKALAVKNYE